MPSNSEPWQLRAVGTQPLYKHFPEGAVGAHPGATRAPLDLPSDLESLIAPAIHMDNRVLELKQQREDRRSPRKT